MALEFTLEIVVVEKNSSIYIIRFLNRFFVDKNDNAIKELTKIQEHALKTAAINDQLNIEINHTTGTLTILNAESIRNKWEQMKPDEIKKFPELKDAFNRFSKQLQDNKIQSVYRTDNFLNFMFSNNFSTFNVLTDTWTQSKNIGNALGTFAIPIVEKNTIAAKRGILDTTYTIESNARIHTEDPIFSIDKINYFLGTLQVKEGETCDLSFEYKARYDFNLDTKLPEKGTLYYQFKFGEQYVNTNKFTLKILPDE